VTFAVSPRFDDTKLASGAVDDLIDVYEDQVIGWLLEPARLMTGNQHAGFAILGLALTYFEPLGQSLDGNPRASEPQFSKGLQAVFPRIHPSVPAAVFKELYNQLRCGMYHRGLTKAKVVVTRGTQLPIVVTLTGGADVQAITVDPWSLLEAIAIHHSGHVARLRNPAESSLRTNFAAWFKSRAA
jgi:hypothetical protein